MEVWIRLVLVVGHSFTYHYTDGYIDVLDDCKYNYKYLKSMN